MQLSPPAQTANPAGGTLMPSLPSLPHLQPPGSEKRNRRRCCNSPHLPNIAGRSAQTSQPTGADNSELYILGPLARNCKGVLGKSGSREDIRKQRGRGPERPARFLNRTHRPLLPQLSSNTDPTEASLCFLGLLFLLNHLPLPRNAPGHGERFPPPNTPVRAKAREPRTNSKDQGEKIWEMGL